MNTLPPLAEKGKSVKQAWDALVKWARGAVILSGPGVRLGRSSTGTTISFHAPRQVFSGAFKVVLSGETATVGTGTIEGVEPTINGIPIGGDKTRPAPSLTLSKSKFNDAGKSWVCARVTLKDGKIDPKDKTAVVIIQSDRPHGNDAKGTFAPLAMLRKSDPSSKDVGDLYQIAYWNLRVYKNTANRVLIAP